MNSLVCVCIVYLWFLSSPPLFCISSHSSNIISSNSLSFSFLKNVLAYVCPGHLSCLSWLESVKCYSMCFYLSRFLSKSKIFNQVNDWTSNFHLSFLELSFLQNENYKIFLAFILKNFEILINNYCNLFLRFHFDSFPVCCL